MNKFLTAFKYFLIAVLLGTSIYLLYTQAKPFVQAPCTTPLVYSIGTIDPRFGISKIELEEDLGAAGTVWNTALGKNLIIEGEGGITINLVYSSHQATAELGKVISADQAAYNAKKSQVESMKSSFNKTKDSVESLQERYSADVAAYQKEVTYWNAQGGAPEVEYKRLEARKAELEQEQSKLNKAIDSLNNLADELNGYVAELNTLGKKINTKADAYNATAGTDFEQGQYKEENGAKSITVYEFTTTTTLERVLAHEFGHALGLEHVENPDSVMYAYNIGDTLTLSPEDLAELSAVCKLK